MGTIPPVSPQRQALYDHAQALADYFEQKGETEQAKLVRDNAEEHFKTGTARIWDAAPIADLRAGEAFYRRLLGQDP